MSDRSAPKHPHPKLQRGPSARLFPVLADTNREKRIASIFMAILPLVPELATQLLSTVGHRMGKRSKIDAYTEVMFKDEAGPNKKSAPKDRPDALLVVHNGKNCWEALIEAKIAKEAINQNQVERYLELARTQDIDAVITISNEFVARPDHSPVVVRKTLLRKTGLYHWSWTFIRTQCEILREQDFDNPDKLYLLNQFLQLLEDKATGIERFAQMPDGWTEVVKMVTHKQPIPKSSGEAAEVVAGWFSELRDASLMLSREVAKPVVVKIDRNHGTDPDKRLKEGIEQLCKHQTLTGTFKVPNAAADIELQADLNAKDASVGMLLKAPQDKKRTSARVNWLLRMLKEDDPRLGIRAHWPGRRLPTHQPISILRENPDAIDETASDMAPHSFEVIMLAKLGQRFGKRVFIEEVETLLTDFYWKAGQYLRAWQAPPPKPLKRGEEAPPLPEEDFEVPLSEQS